MTNKCTLIIIIVTGIGLGILLHTLHQLTKPLPAPQLNADEFWGPSNASRSPNKAIRSMHIHYDASIIGKLRQRLSNINTTEYHASLQDAAWHSYGIDTTALQDFVNYWGGQYLDKWPQREAILNEVPHFKTEIQG